MRSFPAEKRREGEDTKMKSCCLFLVALCLTVAQFTIAENPAQKPCNGKRIIVRSKVFDHWSSEICNKFVPGNIRGLSFVSRSQEAIKANDDQVQDLKSLLIIHNDLSAVLRGEVPQGDRILRERILREIHGEIGEVMRRNDYLAVKGDFGQERVRSAATSDRGQLQFLFGSSIEALDRRSDGRFMSLEYRDLIFAMHIVTDNVAERNGYVFKEPKRFRWFQRRFLFF